MIFFHFFQDRTQLSIRRAIVKPFIMNKLLFQTSNDGPTNLSLSKLTLFFLRYDQLRNKGLWVLGSYSVTQQSEVYARE